MILGLRNRGGKRGFTLIELMVVLVLISILTAMIIPEMRGTFQDALLRSTARKLVNVLTLANSSAITTSTLHVVQLDLKNGHYRIRRNALKTEDASSIPETEVPGGKGEIDTRISVQLRKIEEEPDEDAGPANSKDEVEKADPSRGIAFYPDGTADGAEILLRDRDGFRMALRINSATARVQIVEMERE
jgi:type II secretion system protein H